nr:hypothetical protein [Zymomonas mobilis]
MYKLRYKTLRRFLEQNSALDFRSANDVGMYLKI